MDAGTIRQTMDKRRIPLAVDRTAGGILLMGCISLLHKCPGPDAADG